MTLDYLTCGNISGREGRIGRESNMEYREEICANCDYCKKDYSRDILICMDTFLRTREGDGCFNWKLKVIKGGKGKCR